jgi:hypothetical protein
MKHSSRTLANERLIEELLAGRTVTAAAAAVGISRTTAHRRLADPGFHAELVARRDDRRRAISDDLTAGAAEAVALLRSVLVDTLVKMPDRIRAASVLLSHHLPITEAVEFAHRLEELEVAAARERPALLAVPAR